LLWRAVFPRILAGPLPAPERFVSRVVSKLFDSVIHGDDGTFGMPAACPFGPGLRAVGGGEPVGSVWSAGGYSRDRFPAVESALTEQVSIEP
jgi:hypothetical protein